MSYRVSARDIENLTLNETDRVRAVLQNVAIILMTPQMSIPLFRNFGLPRKFIDKPLPLAKTVLIAEVAEAIQNFEPLAAIKNITFETDGENPGTVIPVVEVDVKNE